VTQWLPPLLVLDEVPINEKSMHAPVSIATVSTMRLAWSPRAWSGRGRAGDQLCRSISACNDERLQSSA